MASNDIFSKLSRILETHNFTTDDRMIDQMVSEYVDNDLGFISSGSNQQTSAHSSPAKQNSSTNVIKERLIQEADFSFPGSGGRPTPFEVWKKNSQSKISAPKETTRLSEQQWDRVADKLSNSNRVKQSASIRQQNSGLAEELGGHQFRPKLNKTSLELATSLKPLTHRIEDMLKEKERALNKRREELAKESIAECSFQPVRQSSKISDKYLRRIGRSKITPDDLIRYNAEKKQRNDQRKKIVDEVESRELTFKPRINLKSQRLDSRLQENEAISVDPTTKVRSYKVKKTNDDTQQVREGIPLKLQSDHPYPHNACQYDTVNIPNAVRYKITFDSRTSTEPIHDYIRFYRDDIHEEYFGATKYSGGYNGTPSNWPGVDNRPALIIDAPKFVIHFKSNGTVNDWGFLINVVPYIKLSSDNESDTSSVKPGKPQISYLGKTYGKKAMSESSVSEYGVDVHQRLYHQGVEKIASHRELMKELIQSKINLPLTHHEGDPKNRLELSQSRTLGGTSMYEDDEIVPMDTSDVQLTVVEYDDNVAFLYKSLHNATLFTG